MEATKEVITSDHYEALSTQWHHYCCFAYFPMVLDPSLKLFTEVTNQWQGESFCSLTKPHLHNYCCYTHFPIQPGYLSASIPARIVSQRVQLSFNGEKCVLMLCAWKVAFLKSGHILLFVLNLLSMKTL